MEPTPYQMMASQQQPQQHQSREAKGIAQPHARNAGYSFDSYPAHPSGSTLHADVTSAGSTSYPRQMGYNGNGDVAMQDVDAYGKVKHSSRPPHHQHQSSMGGGGSRLDSQYGPHDDSAPRRYSPMDTLSPSSPYANVFRQPSQNSGPHTSQGYGSRQSPTKPDSFSSPTQPYYSSCTCWDEIRLHRCQGANSFLVPSLSVSSTTASTAFPSIADLQRQSTASIIRLWSAWQRLLSRTSISTTASVPSTRSTAIWTCAKIPEATLDR